MNWKIFVLLAVMVLLLIAAPVSADGAMQISGIGFFAGEECDVQGQGADFALNMTGDLEGCHYVFVETSTCTPSGTYKETGTELFVSKDGGSTFRTTYRFTAKYEDCPNLAEEIFGRCQHPIIAGSGTGDFEGVTGRLDFKDDLSDPVNPEFPFRGHLRW